MKTPRLVTNIKRWFTGDDLLGQTDEAFRFEVGMNRVIFFIILCLLALALVKICKGAENKNTLAGAPPSTTDGVGGNPVEETARRPNCVPRPCMEHH